jgi:hypothetical protein
MSCRKSRISRLEQAAEDRRPTVCVIWHEDVLAGEVADDDEDVQIIRLEWEVPR